MPLLDVVDETFVVAPLEKLRSTFCDETAWKALGFDLHCYDDRGEQGKRWTLGGRLTGTAEVWLEPVGDGVTVHVYLRADPVRRVRLARMRRRYAHPVKRWVLDVKAAHDLVRPAGVGTPTHGKISAPDEVKVKER